MTPADNQGMSTVVIVLVSLSLIGLLLAAGWPPWHPQAQFLRGNRPARLKTLAAGVVFGAAAVALVVTQSVDTSGVLAVAVVVFVMQTFVNPLWVGPKRDHDDREPR